MRARSSFRPAPRWLGVVALVAGACGLAHGGLVCYGAGLVTAGIPLANADAAFAAWVQTIERFTVLRGASTFFLSAALFAVGVCLVARRPIARTAAFTWCIFAFANLLGRAWLFERWYRPQLLSLFAGGQLAREDVFHPLVWDRSAEYPSSGALALVAVVLAIALVVPTRDDTK